MKKRWKCEEKRGVEMIGSDEEEIGTEEKRIRLDKRRLEWNQMGN